MLQKNLTLFIRTVSTSTLSARPKLLEHSSQTLPSSDPWLSRLPSSHCHIASHLLFLCHYSPHPLPVPVPPWHIGSTCPSDMGCLFYNSRRDCRALTTVFSLTCGAWGCPSWSWQSADTPSPHRTLKSWKASSDGLLWMGPKGRVTPTCRGPDHRADP